MHVTSNQTFKVPWSLKPRLKFEDGPSRRAGNHMNFQPKITGIQSGLRGGALTASSSSSPSPRSSPRPRHQHASKRRKSCMCLRPYVPTTFCVLTWTVPGACTARHSLHRTGGRAQPQPPPGTHGCACRGLQQQRNGKPLLAPTLYRKVLRSWPVISAATPLLNVWSWCEFCCGSRWEGAAVLLSQLSAVVSAPPLVPKTIPVSPVNPWSIVWLLILGCCNRLASSLLLAACCG